MAKDNLILNKGGRPSEYSEEILVKTMDYIDGCEDLEQQQLTGLSVKGTELYKNKMKVNIPTIEGLAYHLDVSRDTIYDWSKKFEEFSYIIDKLRAKQAQELINKGLSGDYNPTIAKVLLTKHGYADKTETDITSKGEKIESINYIIPDANHLKAN